jgi:hypothetical protein
MWNNDIFHKFSLKLENLFHQKKEEIKMIKILLLPWCNINRENKSVFKLSKKKSEFIN